MAYPVDGTIGARIVASPTAEFALGTRVKASDGQEWVYCQANAAVGIGEFVAIDEDFQATKATVALITNAAFIGVSQIVLANDEYAFIPVQGAALNGLVDGATDINPGQPLAISAAAAGNVALYTTTTQIKLAGVMTTVTISTAAGTTTEVLLSNPVQLLV